MKIKMTRRRFIAAMLLAAPLAVVADAKWFEPKWLKVRRLRIAMPRRRIGSFTSPICITRATAPTRKPS
jgi:hypothetical protein